MALSPKEQAELEALESELEPADQALTPEEQEELAALESEFEPAAAPVETPNAAESAVRGAVSGLTWGAAPYITGAVESAAGSLGLVPDKTFQQAKDESVAAYDAAEEAHPYVYNAAGIGAGLATGGALAKGAVTGAKAAAGSGLVKRAVTKAGEMGVGKDTVLDAGALAFDSLVGGTNATLLRQGTRLFKGAKANQASKFETARRDVAVANDRAVSAGIKEQKLAERAAEMANKAQRREVAGANDRAVAAGLKEQKLVDRAAKKSPIKEKAQTEQAQTQVNDTVGTNAKADPSTLMDAVNGAGTPKTTQEAVGMFSPARITEAAKRVSDRMKAEGRNISPEEVQQQMDAVNKSTGQNRVSAFERSIEAKLRKGQ